MSYVKLKNTWSEYIEYYTPRITMPYREWVKYVHNGSNVLLGSGGVIPSGTQQTPGGLSGSVYRGSIYRKTYS
jgi:hypothetical protein